MIYFIIASIISFYLWTTEEGGVLRKPFAYLAARVKNKYLNKGLFECLHCRSFWATVLIMSYYVAEDYRYFFAIPLVWILSITGYRLL